MFDRIKQAWRQPILAEAAPKRPAPGRIFEPMKADAEREYVSAGLTPARLATLLKDFDAGDLAKGLELAAQIEEKDLHLASVANTRRLALTGLPWQIVSAAEVDEIEDAGLRQRADEAAAFCKQVLRNTAGFDAALRHLALAIGRNLAVCEVVWGPDGLESLVPVPHTRLTYAMDGEQPELRILTREAAQDGIRMEPAKWMVHTPHAMAGLPMWGGLLRASAAAYMAKGFAVKDWLVFVELFGMPVRIAKYEPSASDKDKRELLAMLRSLGSDAAGIFSKAVELELKESSGRQGESPYERVCSFFNAELSKAWLGQTLTTEVGDSGSRALGDVHDRVRGDLLADDIRAEGDTVRDSLLAPMAQFKIGPDVPVPYFRRRKDETRDPVALCDVAERAARGGVLVDRVWLATELGLQTTEDAEAALQVPQAAAPSFRFPLIDRDGVGEVALADADQRAADRYAEQALGQLEAAHREQANLAGRMLDAAIAAGVNDANGLRDFFNQALKTGEYAPVNGIAEAIEPLMLAGNLQGRLAVQQRIEARRMRGGKITGTQPGRRRTERLPRELRKIIAADAAFSNIPFTEAIEALRNRLAMTRPAFDELSRQAKSRTFTVAWVDSLRMLRDIHAAAVAAMETGETLRDFRLRLPEMAEQAGWFGERPWHADLVLRQQSMMATQAGRFQQMGEVGITHWMYSALGDGRTRPEHAALDGRVFPMSDRTFWPPWDFNCRCVAEPVFAEELADATVNSAADLLGIQIGSNPETGEPIRLQLPSGAGAFEWDPAAFGEGGNVELELKAAA